MNTTTIFPNLDHDHHRSTTTTTTTTTITAPNNPSKLFNVTKADSLPSKLKCSRKKRSAGKKDKQSKIHTAQGLRDRRMRLSVHTARKFFDLNDMLGFDKASKTIEWLFNKSHEAIQEVTETLQSDATSSQADKGQNNVVRSPFSTCESESMMEIATTIGDKDENKKLHGDQIEDDSLITVAAAATGAGAGARAGMRARIRDRIMIKNHEKKKKQLFEAKPSDDINPSQLGFYENLDDHNMNESTCYPVEFSNTYHFLKHLHLDNTVRNPDIYMGNITTIASSNHPMIDYNHNIVELPVCWLNSRNPLLGFNNRIVPNVAPMNGHMNTENPSSAMISTNFMNFNSENMG